MIGKYHPHGDTAAYDAMVRLAQDFALRYPLVEGQGNFGNIDGDNAAAYRYTEARLTKTAMRLMDGLDAGTVDFIPTYNGEEEEPALFPGVFPNLLANGASGIAVGMATNIPSHNVAEIVDATLALIDDPQVEHARLMELFHGPDLPTGGLIVDSAESISKAYETGTWRVPDAGALFVRRGEGQVRPRGRASSGWVAGSGSLVVSEMPYQVSKGRLIEQIATLIGDRKLPILDDVRDESDEAIRIVLVPRSRNVDPELLKESLYKLTDLESRFSLNLNVLDATRTPMVMGLKEVLANWVAAQIDILQRRSRHRLEKIAARLELVEGYIAAFLNLDRVIEIIRTTDEPKPLLMAEFELTDRQAEAILNMRLRSLRKLEEMELRGEKEALLKEQAALELLLSSPARQRTRLKRDLTALRKEYAEDTALGARRTTIAEAKPTVAFSMDAMIEKEPVTIVLSQKGWIRAAKGHVELDGTTDGRGDFKYKEGDAPAFALHAHTTDKLLIAAANGRFYTLGADGLPGARGFGEPVRTMVDIPSDAGVEAMLLHRPGTRILLAASTGKGFLAPSDNLVAETRKGRQVVNLKGGATLRVVRPVEKEHDHIAAVGDNRKLVVFHIDELPEMGRGQGVVLQRYKGGALSDAVPFTLAEGLSWTMGGKGKRTRTETDIWQWKAARGAAGKLPPQGFPRDNRFS